MTFILMTVVIDAMGIGLIIPVMPALLREIGDIPLADAAIWGGVLATAFAVMQFLFGPIVDKLERILELLLLIGDLPSFYLEWLRGLRWRKASLGVSLACEHRGDAHWPSTPLSEGMPARVCIICTPSLITFTGVR